ncbi:MAG TPA: hypothetical protein VK178_06425 [Opitutaceae bacterium]|nr:hypothetical protein [Opitutaceae bacterium]
MFFFRRTLFVAALLSLLVPTMGLAETVAQMVARARAYVGDERSLSSIRSLRYRGTIEFKDDTGAVVPDASGTLEMILQKPQQQLMIRTNARLRETIALDDLTGWMRVESLEQPGRSHLKILDLDELRRLQANTFENLAFFRGQEDRGGSVELRGERTIDGRTALTVAFAHPHGIVFLRHFDKQTGRLLLTEMSFGGEVREEGELLVNGIRFPRTMRTTGKTKDGKTYSATVTIEEVEVNKAYAADLFAVPLPSAH